MSGPPGIVPRNGEQAAGRGPGFPEVLEGEVRRHPEEPALFYPEGLDVRWRSWRALAEQAADGAEALAAAGLGPGEPVAFRWRCHPDAVAADLAVQWAGGVAVPVAGPTETSAAGRAARLLLPGEERPAGEPEPGPPTVTLPEAEPPWARRRESGRRPAPAGGGARVMEPGGAGGATPQGRDLDPGEILGAARELGSRLGAAAAEGDAAVGARRRRGREIALVHLDLRSLDGRALLSWGLLSGAALFLEPDPRSVPAATAWARPTLVAAGAAPLVELARQLRRREESRLRKLLRRRRTPHPFGRLRLLLVLGGGRLPVDDVPFWAEHGVVVLRACR